MTFFSILNFYMKGACGAFPKQTTVSLLGLCSDFQIIAERRVLVFWNLIWLHFLWDHMHWFITVGWEASSFFFQGVFKECQCFHSVVLVIQLWSLRILPVPQEFSCPAEEITLLICLQWKIVQVSPYSTVCLNSLSNINKHGWIIMLV